MYCILSSEQKLKILLVISLTTEEWNRKWLHYMVDRFIDIRLLKINNSIFNIFSLLSVSVVTQDSTDRTLEKTRVTRDAITVFTGY